MSTTEKVREFYSRYDYHTHLYDGIDLLIDDEKNSVREALGYSFVVEVKTADEAEKAGNNIGQYNGFEPDYAIDAFAQSGGFMYIGYEYSPVIYMPLLLIKNGMLPYADEVQIVTANDGLKYLRLWWD